ncbi:MAG: HpcH/HpaI aldolase/citrate lyase family protein [Lautropia sp.]
MANQLKARMAAGEAVYGLIHGLAAPTVAEMAALAGYDFVVIDGEHAPADRLTLQTLAMAIRSGGSASILRLATDDPALIGQALDLGVDGIMVPGVHDAEQAARIAAAALYPPRGRRGNGALVARAAGYGLATGPYLARANDDLLLAVMLESRAGAEAAGRIAAVDGIDAIVVGAFDLSGDLGIPGAFEHPLFRAAMAGIERDVAAAGKALGSVVYPGTSVADLLDRGHRMITLGADTLLLARAIEAQLATRRPTPRRNPD